MDYFQQWVNNTILELGGIAPQYPCGLQRKLVCYTNNMTNIPAYLRVAKYTNTVHGRLKTLVKGARHSARQKNLVLSITDADIQKLWLDQNGICPYTGWEMTTITNSPKLVSIERKDSSVGYVLENIELICWCVNRAKNNMTKDELLKMCNAIIAH